MSYPTLTPASTTSAVVLTATGSAALVDAALPYRIYSDETSPLYSSDFLSGAAEQVSYVYKKLGGDVLDIELTPGNVYASYEEACLEYSYILNVHQATNLLSNALGDSTGSFDHKGHIKETTPGNTPLATVSGSHVALKYPKFDYGFSRRAAEGVSSEVGLNSSVQYSGSFDVTAGKQDYDLQSIMASVTNVSATGSITFTSCPADDEKITLVDTSGLTVEFQFNTEDNNTTGNGSIGVSAAAVQATDALKAARAASQTADEINAHAIKITATVDDKVVTLTQDIASADGNTTIIDAASGLTVTNFVNGVTTTPYAEKLAGKRILVKKVYYKTPHAMWRFYGYYGGLNVVGNLHNYGQFSDDSSFQLVPTWQNKAQALAFEDAIYTRMSHFSYEIHDNNLRLFPIPQNFSPTKMWVEFSIPSDSFTDDANGSAGIDGINNMNTLPLANLPFENINSIGKQWIRRFSLSLSKEILGQVRSKFSQVPIPGESVTLNGTDLVNQAREEQDKLREELKTTLSEMTYVKLSEGDATLAENSNRVMEQMPMHIFVG